MARRESAAHVESRVVFIVHCFTQGGHVLRISRVVVLAVVVLGLGMGCSSTYFVSTWTDPGLEDPVCLTGKKVAAFLLSKQASTRRVVEDVLAGEFTANGAEGIPGYTLMSADEALDQEWVIERLNAEGIEGVVIMRVIGKETETRYVPGTTYYGSRYGSPYYSSMSGYWGPSWSVVHEPGYLETDLIVSVETLVYAVKEDRLLWTGVSETMNPNHVQSMIIELSAAATAEMKKTGLLE